MGETGEMSVRQDKRRQSAILHQVLALQVRECETEANGLAGIDRISTKKSLV